MTTPSTLAQADIILNRTNVALARSQRLIQSWLPAKPTDTTTDLLPQDDGDDDDDAFTTLDELSGLGSKRKAEDEGLPDGAWKRKKLASNDKLLEQLLGKRAAAGVRKKNLGRDGPRGVGMGGVGSNGVGEHVGVKRMPGKVIRGRESEEEEEGGRAAAFTSKKRKVKDSSVPPVQHAREEARVEESGVEGDGGLDDAIKAESEDLAMPVHSRIEVAQRPQKKGTGSYLDEVLGQKSKKKNSKKKNKASVANAS